jgi:class 3 adenylate cyclase
MGAGPGATITFLFSDIEGSTELLTRLGDDYAGVLADQRRILRAHAAANRGREVDTQGDAFFFSFPRARDAVAAAVGAQKELAAHDWPGDVELRVRMGIHTGEPSVADEGFIGLDVVRASRIAAIGHGGQVLISDVTRALVRADLPPGVTVRSLGPQRLRGIEEPEPIHELLIEGIAIEHPPLKSVAPASTARSEFAEHARQAIETQVLAELRREGLFGTRGGPPSTQPPRRLPSRTPWGPIAIAIAVLVVLMAVPIASMLLSR